MKKLMLHELEMLSTNRSKVNVSLYFNLKEKGWTSQNQIHFGFLLEEAKGKLRDRAYLFEVDELIKKLDEIDAQTIDFVNVSSIGLFINSKMSCYRTLNKPVETKSVVASSFHVKPLEHLLNPNLQWIAVHFKQNEIIFYKGASREIEKCDAFVFPPGEMFLHDKISDICSNWIVQNCKINRQSIFVYGLRSTLRFYNFTSAVDVKYFNFDNIERIAVEDALKTLKHRFKSKIHNLKILASERSCIFEIQKIYEEISSDRVESLIVNKELHQPGFLSTRDGQLVTAQNPALVDCVYDDLIELAISKKVDVILCSQENWGTQFGAIALPKPDSAVKYNKELSYL